MKIAFVFNLKITDSLEEAEFDTKEVIEEITSALESNGDEVIQVKMTKDGEWLDKLIECKADLIFNTAEGFYGIGREAFAPTVFEQLKIPYVGSGPYACFLTLDKYLTKKVVETKDVTTPESFYLSSVNDINFIAKDLDYPVFVKPNFEGSSKGITSRSRCQDMQAFISYALESLKLFPEGLLVEKYIEGKDVTVPYIGGLGKSGILPPVEYTGTIRNNFNIYDYEMKNVDDRSIGVKCPANFEDKIIKKLMLEMKKIVDALGVCDMARADFRVTPTGDVYFIEVNALPSLQSGAAIFETTKQLGLDYNQTIQAILSSAKKRNKIRPLVFSKIRKLNKKIPNVALVYNVKRKTASEEDYELEAEFDTKETIDAIAQGIIANNVNPILIEADRNLSKNLLKNDIDVVFNIAEGMNKKSREAQVPAICDLLDIEHTGSDAACLSITLNKSLSSKLVQADNLLAPRSTVFNYGKKNYTHNLNYPIILKPNLEGTSKGIYDKSVVDNDGDFQRLLKECFEFNKGPILCEEYISGREFTVGVMGTKNLQVIGISEICFKDRNKYPVYSFEAKQQKDPYENEYFKLVSPPDITKNVHQKISTLTKKIFMITGCRDIARVDFKMTSNGDIYFIEINPLPGLSPGFSDLTILAEKNGMPYNKLIGHVLKPAISRWRRGQ